MLLCILKSVSKHRQAARWRSTHKAASAPLRRSVRFEEAGVVVDEASASVKIRRQGRQPDKEQNQHAKQHNNNKLNNVCSGKQPEKQRNHSGNPGLWSFAKYTVPSGAWNALTGRPTVQRFPAGGVPLHSMVTDKLCPTSRAEPPLLERSTVTGGG